VKKHSKYNKADEGEKKYLRNTIKIEAMKVKKC